MIRYDNAVALDDKANNWIFQNDSFWEPVRYRCTCFLEKKVSEPLLDPGCD